MLKSDWRWLNMPKNVSDNPRMCRRCGAEYVPTGNRQENCVACIRELDRERCTAYYKRTYAPKGYSQVRENNNAWRGGIGVYRKLVESRPCALCGSTKHLVVHHKDHDRSNPDVSNLVVWCRSCHSKHHLRRDSKGRYITHVEGIV